MPVVEARLDEADLARDGLRRGRAVELDAERDVVERQRAGPGAVLGEGGRGNVALVLARGGGGRGRRRLGGYRLGVPGPPLK